MFPRSNQNRTIDKEFVGFCPRTLNFVASDICPLLFHNYCGTIWLDPKSFYGYCWNVNARIILAC